MTKRYWGYVLVLSLGVKPSWLKPHGSTLISDRRKQKRRGEWQSVYGAEPRLPSPSEKRLAALPTCSTLLHFKPFENPFRPFTTTSAIMRLTLPATISFLYALHTSAQLLDVLVIEVSDETGALRFKPAEARAPVGTFVDFIFYPQSHSVARSNFENPCAPTSASPFFSGFQQVVLDTAIGDKRFRIQVTDDKPIWYYCAQGKHCSQGMVGVINPLAADTSQNLMTFTAMANKANAVVVPSQITPSLNDSPSAGNNTSSGTTTASSSSTSASSSASKTAPATKNAVLANYVDGSSATLLGFLLWLVSLVAIV